MKKMKFRLLFAMLICIAMLFAVGIVTSAEEGGECTSTLDCVGTYEGGVCNSCGGSDEVIASVTVGEESKDYADFHVAFRDAAAAGTATVTLKSDISKEDSIGFSLGDPFDITLDLAGYYMDTYYFDLYYGQTLSIVDSSENMLGVFDGAYGLTSINLRGGTFKFFSGTINTTLMFVPDWSEEKNRELSYAYIYGGVLNDQIQVNHGVLTVSGGTVVGSISCYGVDDVENASVVLTGGRFEGGIDTESLTYRDVIPDGYVIYKYEDETYVSSFTSGDIIKRFTVIEHTHEFSEKSDETHHWEGCYCGADDPAFGERHEITAATCETGAYCSICEIEISDPLGHDYSDYEYLGDGTHQRVCSRDESHIDSGECIPNVEKATCLVAKVCTVCEGEIEPIADHTETIPANCETAAYCGVCEEYYGDPLGHNNSEDGVCTVCGRHQPIKITVGSVTVYSDSFNALMELGVFYGVDKASVELVTDYASESVEMSMIANMDLTLDLNGNTLENVQFFISSSNVTVFDSSEEKTGCIIAPFVCLDATVKIISGSVIGDILGDNGIIVFEGGSFEGSINLDRTRTIINGGDFTNLSFCLLDESGAVIAPIIKNGTFSEVLVVGEGLTLGNVFSNADCLSYTDENGNAVTIDPTLTSYSEVFTVSHDDSHGSLENLESDEFYHWEKCVNGVFLNYAKHTIGEEGTCTVCGKNAPYAVTVNGMSRGFIDFIDAIKFASYYNGSVIKLYADAEITSIAFIPVQIKDGNIAVDLNGYDLSINAGSIVLVDSYMKIYDGSEDGDGKLVSASLDLLEESVLIIENITVNDIHLDVSYDSYTEFDGTVFTSEFAIDGYDSYISLVIKSAVFEKGMFSENESYTVYEFIDAPCRSVLNEDGDTLDLEALDVYEYTGMLTVIHSDDFINYGTALSTGKGTHHYVCFVCGVGYGEESCSSESEATCSESKTCDVCGFVISEPIEHDLEGSECTVCGYVYCLELTVGTSVFYFDDFMDLFDYIRYDETNKIRLLGDYVDVKEYEYDFEVFDGSVIIDLNGYSLVLDEINLYEGNYVIIDSSDRKSGYFALVDTLDIYDGSLTVDGVKNVSLTVDLNEDYIKTELIIKDSVLNTLEVDFEYGEDGNNVLFVQNSVIGGLSIDCYECEANVVLDSVEILDYIDLYGGSYDFYLIDLIQNCMIYLNERGSLADIDPLSTYHDGYVKIVHIESEHVEEYNNYDEKYHWYECDCGIKTDVEAHKGGTATCDELAVCEICGEEYGIYTPHSFDENGKCTVCETEIEMIFKVDVDGRTYYYEDLGYALFELVDMGGYRDLTVTLLKDTSVTYFEPYGNITFDLNGHSLTVEELSVYAGSHNLIDSSEEKSGTLESERVTMYGGALDISAGKANVVVYVVNDIPSFIISGGVGHNVMVFMYENSKSPMGISGGIFDTLAIMSTGESNFVISGGEFEGGIMQYAMLSNNSLLKYLPNACYSYVDENGNAINDLDVATSYFGYIKVVHIENTIYESFDGNTHVELCGTCGATVKHLPHVYDNNCDADCNECKAERTPADHVYDNNCDADCNECEAERTPAAHVYDNNCDTTCNECGFERSVPAHSYGSVTVVTEPSNSESGEGFMSCSECAHTVAVEIPAKGGLSTGATVAITAGTTAAASGGIAALLWFVLKKKFI